LTDGPLRKVVLPSFDPEMEGGCRSTRSTMELVVVPEDGVVYVAIAASNSVESS